MTECCLTFADRVNTFYILEDRVLKFCRADFMDPWPPEPAMPPGPSRPGLEGPPRPPVVSCWLWWGWVADPAAAEEWSIPLSVQIVCSFVKGCF